ncbi:hypothetical protein J8273_1024 [Carpediemonas membranifera]|uniref:TmcB/TmcC TPR repeats domain-containing protein n=1 Tax=Carpediemonas membranifera TaxID=201153 RepID=A0A8J6C112_9EUKA|nr:hypothetical protein J8273_1024 [Carpediemonas membranifera]|eukprot:KAG9397116.1 hypothetical protein J8273_1024 [Carpediemonas membranifera]
MRSASMGERGRRYGSINDGLLHPAAPQVSSAGPSSRISTISFSSDTFGLTGGKVPWASLKLVMAIRTMGMRFPMTMLTLGRILSVFFFFSFIIQTDPAPRDRVGAVFLVPMLNGKLLTDQVQEVVIWVSVILYWSSAVGLLLFVILGKQIAPNNVVVSRMITSVHRVISTALFIPAVVFFTRVQSVAAPFREVTVFSISNPFGWMISVCSIVLLVCIATLTRLAFFNHTLSKSLNAMTQLPSVSAAIAPLTTAVYIVAMHYAPAAPTSPVRWTLVALTTVMPIVYALTLFVFPAHAHPASMAFDTAIVLCAGVAGVYRFFDLGRVDLGIVTPISFFILYIAVYISILIRYAMLTKKFATIIRPSKAKGDQPESAASQTHVPPGLFTAQSLFFYAFCRSRFGGLSMSMIRQKRDRLEFLSFMQPDDNCDANLISEIHQIADVLESVTVNTDSHFGPTLFSRINFIIYIQYIRANTDAAIFEIFRAFDHVKGPIDALSCVYLYALYQNAENSRRTQHRGFDSAMLRRLHVKLKTVQRQVMQAKLAINTFWSILARDKVDILELHRVSEQIYASSTSAERTFIWLLEYFPQRIPVITMYADFLRNVALAPDAADKLDSYAEYLGDQGDSRSDSVRADYRVEFEHNNVLKGRKHQKRSPFIARLELTIAVALSAIAVVIAAFIGFQLVHIVVEFNMRSLHSAATAYSGRLVEFDFLLRTQVSSVHWPDLPVHPFDSDDMPLLERTAEVLEQCNDGVRSLYDHIKMPLVDLLWPSLISSALDHNLMTYVAELDSVTPEGIYSTASVDITSLVQFSAYISEIGSDLLSGATISASTAYYAHFNILHCQLPRLYYLLDALDSAMNDLAVVDCAVSELCVIVILGMIVLGFPAVFIHPTIAVKHAQERNLNLFMRIDKGIAAMMARSTDTQKTTGYVPSADDLLSNSALGHMRHLSALQLGDRDASATTQTSHASLATVDDVAYSLYDEEDADTAYTSDSVASDLDDQLPHGDFSDTITIEPAPRYSVNPATVSEQIHKQSSQDLAKHRISALSSRFASHRRRAVILMIAAGVAHLASLVLGLCVIVCTVIVPKIAIDDYKTVYASNVAIQEGFDHLLAMSNAQADAALAYAQCLDLRWIEEYDTAINGQRVASALDYLMAQGHDGPVAAALASAYTAMLRLTRLDAISLYQSANAAGASLPISSQCFLSGMAYNYTAEPTHLLQALVYNSSRSRGYYSDAGADALLSSNDSFTVARNILVDPAYIEISDRIKKDLLAARDTLLDNNKARLDELFKSNRVLDDISVVCASLLMPLVIISGPILMGVLAINRRLDRINGEIAGVQEWIVERPDTPFRLGEGATRRASKRYTCAKLCVGALFIAAIVVLNLLIIVQWNLWGPVWDYEMDSYNEIQYFHGNRSEDLLDMHDRIRTVKRYAQFGDVTLGYQAMVVLSTWPDTVEGISASIAVLADKGVFDFSGCVNEASAQLEAATNASASIEHILRISFQLATEAASLDTTLPLPHYSYDASTEDDTAEDALHYPARSGHMYSSDTADGLLDADVQAEMARLLLFDDKMVDLFTEFEVAVNATTSVLLDAYDTMVFASDADTLRRGATTILEALALALLVLFLSCTVYFVGPPSVTWALRRVHKIHVRESWRNLRLAVLLAAVLVGLVVVGAVVSVLADFAIKHGFVAIRYIVIQLLTVLIVENDGIDLVISPAASHCAHNHTVCSLEQMANATISLAEVKQASPFYTAVIPDPLFPGTCPHCSFVPTGIKNSELQQLLVSSVNELRPDGCLAPGTVASSAFSILREIEYPMTSVLWEQYRAALLATSATDTVGRIVSVLLLTTALVSIPIIFRMLKHNVFAAFVAQEMLVKSLLAMVPEASLKRNYLLSMMHTQVVRLSKDDIQFID